MWVQQEMEEVKDEVMIQDLPLYPDQRNLTSHHKTIPGKEMKPEKEEEPEIQDVPLHLIQRNLLSHHKADLKTQKRERSAMVIYTEKGQSTDEHTVLFPNSEKVNTLVKCRKWDWIEDTSSDTIETLKEIKMQAVAKIKQEEEIKKVFSVQFPAFVQHTTSSKQKNHGKLKEKPKIPQVTGYSDTYDWDGHFNLPPNLTFSRRRHYMRMARLAEMEKCDDTPLEPLEDINTLLSMTPDELFDQIDGPQEV